MEGSGLGVWLKISEVIIHPPKAIYGGRYLLVRSSQDSWCCSKPVTLEYLLFTRETFHMDFANFNGFTHFNVHSAYMSVILKLFLVREN